MICSNFLFKPDLSWYNEIDEKEVEDRSLIIYLVVDILEVSKGSDLPLDQSRVQAMKFSSVLGYDEPFISNRLQDVDGDKNISQRHLYRSTASGIYETKYEIFSL